MQISSSFDGGNIAVKSLKNPKNIELAIQRDNGSHFFQWFYYRVTGAKGTPLVMKIVNAGKAAYPKAFKGYRACASYDRARWFRVPTSYDGKTLTIRHTPAQNAVYYAYFAPYSMERHADLVAAMAQRDGVTAEVLGQTLDGQDLDLLVIDDHPKRKKLHFWITCRQHPGETMAEWWAEGFLERLTDPADPVSRKLRDHVRLFVIPNINPDGSRRGHLRTNAAGTNLNREWGISSMKKSPEVHLTIKAMKERGMDFHLDVHGDEEIPYNFLIGFEGIPDPDPELMAHAGFLTEKMARISPDFQTRHGYPKVAPGKADLTISSNYVAHALKAPSLTLEMPFKDNADLPDPVTGWSPERTIRLAYSFVDGLWALARRLEP